MRGWKTAVAALALSALAVPSTAEAQLTACAISGEFVFAGAAVGILVLDKLAARSRSRRREAVRRTRPAR